MAVGDGYNDIAMIQEAKIGVQITETHVGRIFGDILVDNLLCLPKIINNQCRDWNNNLHQAVTKLFKYTTLIMSSNIGYQLY